MTATYHHTRLAVFICSFTLFQSFIIAQTGNVGIGTTTPAARLHVKDSNVLFTGEYPVPATTSYDPPVQGSGTRMMWYPSKGAFRVGVVSGTQWDKDNIGTMSFATGYNTKANGDYSTATGEFNIASGTASTAMGFLTTASGEVSTAMGYIIKSKSFAGTVIGTYNDSTNAANSYGFNPANRIFQIGNGTADDARSNAMTVLQNGNVGIGTVSPGFPLNFSNALGDKISLWGNSGDHYGFGIQNNLMQLYTDVAVSDIAFGYGSSASFTETMRIKGNGNLGIGTNTPTQKLHVAGNICYTGTIGACSDIRYKKDISSIDNPLSSVLSLHGIYYNWKQNEFPEMQFTDNRQLGFSAQELEKYFPELVMTDARGYKSVDYGRLTPVLVEAIKEQQQQISSQQNQIKSQQQQIDELKKAVEKLSKQ